MHAMVAHDSYEQLVEVLCAGEDHRAAAGVDSGLTPLSDLVSDIAVVGIDTARLQEAAHRDPDIAEFSRFYLQRREQEVEAAGGELRKRKKLEDDFTPRIEATLVALDGIVARRVTVMARYRLDGADYESALTVMPRDGTILDGPAMAECELSRTKVPVGALETCAMSGRRALKHRLVRSDASGRYGLPNHTVRCSASSKTLLLDEAGFSEISNAAVDKRLLKTCAVSGVTAEQDHFGTCAFTKGEVLRKHLAASEVSERLYRTDQQTASSVSGKTGHKSEFIMCQVTHQPLLADEAERCEQTGKRVRPGVLAGCAVTGKRVLPDQLERSSITGTQAIRSQFIASSVSGARFLEAEGIRSAYGKYCTPVEGRHCQWSGEVVNPDDIRTCSLLGLPVHFQYLADESGRLQVVDELLNGVRRSSHGEASWQVISLKASGAVKSGKCRIEAAEFSPNGQHLAICAEIKSLLGLRVQHAAMLYSLKRNAIVGRVAIGKRDRAGWR